MDISFGSARLARLLASDRDLTRRYGAIGARKVRTRLIQIEAADTLADMRLMPGRCHELKGDRRGGLAVEVHGGLRLVFKPADPVPQRDDGGLAWDRVEAVIVLEVVDYH